MNQLFRFCMVGLVGFLIDVCIFQILVVTMSTNPYIARIASFISAASVTWIMNRNYTFEVLHKPSHSEWLHYVSFMMIGALVNYGAFVLCLKYWVLVETQLWLGVAVGSIAGLGVNFTVSRIIFFKFGRVSRP